MLKLSRTSLFALILLSLATGTANAALILDLDGTVTSTTGNGVGYSEGDTFNAQLVVDTNLLTLSRRNSDAEICGIGIDTHGHCTYISKDTGAITDSIFGELNWDEDNPPARRVDALDNVILLAGGGLQLSNSYVGALGTWVASTLYVDDTGLVRGRTLDLGLTSGSGVFSVVYGLDAAWVDVAFSVSELVSSQTRMASVPEPGLATILLTLLLLTQRQSVS